MTENQNTYTMSFTADEYDKITSQLTARLDDLENLICTAGEKKQVARVIQISDLITTIRSFRDKMSDAYCAGTSQSVCNSASHGNFQSQFDLKRGNPYE